MAARSLPGGRTVLATFPLATDQIATDELATDQLG
jgi:hypothetical protein